METELKIVFFANWLTELNQWVWDQGCCLARVNRRLAHDFSLFSLILYLEITLRNISKANNPSSR
jgi:hypothetical protein